MCNFHSNNVILRLDFVLIRPIATWMICRRRACLIILTTTNRQEVAFRLVWWRVEPIREDNSSNDMIGADFVCFPSNTLQKDHRSTVKCCWNTKLPQYVGIDYYLNHATQHQDAALTPLMVVLYPLPHIFIVISPPTLLLVGMPCM